MTSAVNLSVHPTKTSGMRRKTVYTEIIAVDWKQPIVNRISHPGRIKQDFPALHREQDHT